MNGYGRSIASVRQYVYIVTLWTCHLSHVETHELMTHV